MATSNSPHQLRVSNFLKASGMGFPPRDKPLLLAPDQKAELLRNHQSSQGEG